jgi:hypothetical protein
LTSERTLARERSGPRNRAVTLQGMQGRFTYLSFGRLGSATPTHSIPTEVGLAGRQDAEITP